MEMWRDVNGYEGLYEVSDNGNVRSKERTVAGKSGTTRNIKGGPICAIVDRGYLCVKLYKENIGTWHKVHRIELAAFSNVPGSDDLDVNHKDGIKLNNRLYNLEWCSRKENLLHAVEIGLNTQCQPIKAKKGDTEITSKSIAGMYAKISTIEPVRCKEKTFKENVRRALITHGAYYGYTFCKVVT